MSTPMAALSKEWFCAQLLAGVVASYLTRSMYVCLLLVLHVVGLITRLITAIHMTVSLFSIDRGVFILLWLIPTAAPSKAWVFGRSLVGIAGSNPAGGMNVSLL